MFAKFELDKAVQRLVLPDYGLCAIVEFAQRQEARSAFKKLAYRKFRNVPIYLEWAPVDVFEGDEEEKEALKKREADEKHEALLAADLDYMKKDQAKRKWIWKLWVVKSAWSHLYKVTLCWGFRKLVWFITFKFRVNFRVDYIFQNQWFGFRYRGILDIEGF